MASGTRTLRDRNDLPLLSADDLTSEMLTELTVIAVPVVAEKRRQFSDDRLGLPRNYHFEIAAEGHQQLFRIDKMG